MMYTPISSYTKLRAPDILSHEKGLTTTKSACEKEHLWA